MPDTSGTSPFASPSAVGSRTEFDRSIARESDTSGESETSSAASDLKDKLSEDIAGVTETAKEVASNVTDKAAEIADKQKSYAADQIGKLAGALEKVGNELKSDDANAMGGYAAELGASARQFADKVKDKNFREIASVAEEFGRRQPLAFLGLAAVAGLAASRFIMASKTSAVATSSSVPDSNRATESYNG